MLPCRYRWDTWMEVSSSEYRAGCEAEPWWVENSVRRSRQVFKHFILPASKFIARALTS